MAPQRVAKGTPPLLRGKMAQKGDEPGVNPRQKRNVIFFHPDLGIGGAERLIVDAAAGLQELGHKVTIFTSHCDKSHCFEEVRDGKLRQLHSSSTQLKSLTQVSDLQAHSMSEYEATLSFLRPC